LNIGYDLYLENMPMPKEINEMVFVYSYKKNPTKLMFSHHKLLDTVKPVQTGIQIEFTSFASFVKLKFPSKFLKFPSYNLLNFFINYHEI
jgi:hypothetical protein